MENLGITIEQYNYLMACLGLVLGFLLNLFVIIVLSNFK